MRNLWIWSAGVPLALASVSLRAQAPAPSVSSDSVKTPYNEMTDDPFYNLGRIDWPGPNAYRDASGMPGPKYWQQRADYTIKATLDTSARSLTGDVHVTYTNNSPDTLRFVLMHLDQNPFRS